MAVGAADQRAGGRGRPGGAARWLPESRARDGRRLDLPGALLVTAGLATLAYGIVQTEAEGWTAAATLVPLCAGLALIGLFLAVEARTKEPLMPLKLLGRRPVASANVAMFVNGSAMFCMWFFMTLYAQNVLGYTPLGAGLALVPSSLAVLLGRSWRRVSCRWWGRAMWPRSARWWRRPGSGGSRR
ncbi:hypothetical protein SAV31267_031940 [Streptomyces avermitilis]|uniref:Major facilitator superfamily (MFS) profile domain-containing protein n=1 Tax=Streptomyces avermitilis TaxID=33903 RepID=A0A4D4MQM4_STRAX|nr:hypothetical protein SAV31267_031940 [Streptomyces avermitilis]